MSAIRQKISTCLWFDTQAEEAANFYVSVFRNGKINAVSRYGEAGHERHGRKAGSVMVVEFEIEGRTFTALNGGPHFTFNEAVSLVVSCDSQEEIDHFWNALTEGGKESQCGWLKDKFGLSWQIVPSQLPQIMGNGDAAARERVITAVMAMKKFDISALQSAYGGKA